MDESTAALLQKVVMQSNFDTNPSRCTDTSIPAAANPAIARCIQAYTDALQAYLRKNDNSFIAERIAKAAFRSAMPPLTGSRNIRDYVACVAHAIAINAVDGSDGARLLYAAQVASTAQSAQRRIKAKSNAITERKPWENMQLPNIEFPVKLAE